MNTKTETKPKTIETLIEGGTLVLTFSSGERLAINPNTLSVEIREQALLHGLKQKLVDAAAISCNPETGKSATVADKYAAVLEVYERITRETAPMWNKVREGGGATSGGLLLQALCVLYPTKSVEDLRAWIAAKTDKERAQLRAEPRIAAEIAKLRPQADASELLSGLDDL